jgi:hypothetical protein
MIDRAELLIILNAADRLDQIEAVQDLIEHGLSVFITDADAITGLTTTPAGAAKLNGMLLPTSHE